MQPLGITQRLPLLDVTRHSWPSRTANAADCRITPGAVAMPSPLMTLDRTPLCRMLHRAKGRQDRFRPLHHLFTPRQQKLLPEPAALLGATSASGSAPAAARPPRPARRPAP